MTDLLGLITECISGDILNTIKSYNDPKLKSIADKIEAISDKFIALDNNHNGYEFLSRLIQTQESAFRFEQMANAIDEVFWMSDLDKNKILYINPAYEKIWGLSCQEPYKDSTSFIKAIHPEDREAVIKAFPKQANGTYDELYRIVRPDGDIRWIHDRSFPPLKMNNGEIRVVGVARDVTETKISRDELKKGKARLQAIIDVSPIPMALNDEQLHITFLNPAFIRTFGYSLKDIPTLSDWWPKAYPNPEYRKWVIESWQNELESSKRTGTEFKPMEIKIVCKDGSIKDVQASATLLDQSQHDDHLVMLYDITDLKKAENERESMRLKFIQNSKLASLGEMAAGIAHEINNPVAIILGAANQLKKFKDDPEKFAAKEDAILKGSMRISKIVSGLKKFSRSAERPAFKLYSISNIIREATSLITSKSTQHNVHLTTHFQTEAQILCDDVAIEQVLINLISNSIDAIKNLSEKWIQLETLEADENIVVRITDSGHGIPQDIRSKIFDPFFTTKPQGEGTGLGLSISRGILDDHNATINLVSDFQNTRFEVRFPKVTKEYAN